MKLKKYIFKLIPAYALLPLIWELIFNTAVYTGSRMIAGNWYHHNLSSALDGRIPFLPWTAAIYFGCYLFWLVNYILCVRGTKEETYRFLSADFIGKCICLVFFLVFPTTNIRPEITGQGFWDQVMRFLYQVDAADNLFPSIHCLVSWMCYIGIRGKQRVPRWYRLSSCLMAAAVFISTLTTRQHVLIDVAGGVLIAEVTFYIAGKCRFTKLYARFFDRLSAAVF